MAAAPISGPGTTPKASVDGTEIIPIGGSGKPTIIVSQILTYFQTLFAAIFAPINNPTFTGTVGGITKAMVGLGNVPNLTFSGSNNGDQDLSGLLVKSQNLADLTNATTARTNLSLGNVDNTSDVNKPISTAVQTALNGKVAALTQVIATDADFNLAVNTVNHLPGNLTANRTITIPTGANIDYFEIVNDEVNFTWNLAGAPLYYAGGVLTLSSLLGSQNIIARKVNTKWRVMN